MRAFVSTGFHHTRDPDRNNPGNSVTAWKIFVDGNLDWNSNHCNLTTEVNMDDYTIKLRSPGNENVRANDWYTYVSNSATFSEPLLENGSVNDYQAIPVNSPAFRQPWKQSRKTYGRYSRRPYTNYDTTESKNEEDAKPPVRVVNQNNDFGRNPVTPNIPLQTPPPYQMLVYHETVIHIGSMEITGQ